MVRMRLICVGEPAVVMPARFHILVGVSFSVVRTRLGKFEILEEDVEDLVLRHREFEIVLAVAGVRGLLAAAWPSPERGFLISSPGVIFLVARQHEIVLAAGLADRGGSAAPACPCWRS